LYRPLRVIPSATETAYVPYKSAFMGQLYNNNNKKKNKKEEEEE
jgi:hypothetical protein